MYVVHPQKRPDGSPAGSIIPLADIRQSCMLFPAFGATCNDSWTADNVLDTCTSFYVNNWSSMYSYKTLW